MKTKNENHTFSTTELEVLAFLKNLKMYSPKNFDYLIFFGTSAKEMVKFMEHPEKYGDFDFQFVGSIFMSIHKTFQHYVIERPEIQAQTVDDKVLGAILMNSSNAFKSIYASERLINKSHLNAYLMRDEVIFKWNGWLLLTVQRKVEEMKAEMRVKFEIAV